jgi:transcription elongation factor Elf1
MDFIDVKYINLISSRLQKFKRVKPKLYNFRCPICGDSQKNKNKARGFLYQVKNNTNFKCHNCGISVSFANFLKDLDPQTYKQYTFEKFKEGKTGKNFVTESPEDMFGKVRSAKPTFKKKINIDLPSAFDVSVSKHYLESRAILSGKFYYAENFQEFVNTLKPGSFQNTKYGEQRIVIPLVRNEKLIGLQGRALSSNPVKYLTIMLDEDEPKIYGLDTIDKSLPVYVTEGPFDSTFIRNSIAMCGADADVDNWGISNPVWIYDNEPRNEHIIRRIEQTIDQGGTVVIWPSGVREKDINDMVLNGHMVQEIVDKNTYKGLEAKLKFTTWKKV